MARHAVVVIGAGQAGLAASYHLAARGIEHVVLEAGRVGETWRSRRWDAFTLVAPNWSATLPGLPYTGTDPDGFMGRDALVAFFAGYAARTGAPVREHVVVERVQPRGEGFTVRTSAGELSAGSVILATGAYQRPVTPTHALDPRIFATHTADYRAAAQLPPGGVLVVGTGQSGAQIAEDLARGGRDTWVAAGGCGWIPRRYRGRDNVAWRTDMGVFEQTVESVPPALRFSAPPMQSGRDGGKDISLRTLVRDGVHVVGRLLALDGRRATLAADVERGVRAGDDAATAFRRSVDEHIAATGTTAPEEPELETAMPDVDTRTQLDLADLGIRSVVWATGWRHDYSWVDARISGERGYPVQHRGVTDVPGLYVIGLQLMWKRKSGLIFGVGEDAEYLAAHIAARMGIEKGRRSESRM